MVRKNFFSSTLSVILVSALGLGSLIGGCDDIDSEELSELAGDEPSPGGLAQPDRDSAPARPLLDVELGDGADDDQVSEAEALDELSSAPDPAAGGVCCALCNNRWNYYHMVGVTQNCAYWAGQWCAENKRGGLRDALWGSCSAPPGGF